MEPVSDKTVSTAFNSERLILERLGYYGQKPAAEATDIDESYISRLKSPEQKVTFRWISKLLDFLHLKIVDKDFEPLPPGHVAVPRDEFEFTTKSTIELLQTRIKQNGGEE